MGVGGVAIINTYYHWRYILLLQKHLLYNGKYNNQAEGEGERVIYIIFKMWAKASIKKMYIYLSYPSIYFHFQITYHLKNVTLRLNSGSRITYLENSFLSEVFVLFATVCIRMIKRHNQAKS